MNRFSKIAASAVVVFCLCWNAAAETAVQFGSVKLRLSLETSPLVVRSGGSGGVYASGGTAFVNKRWLAVQVSYVPGMVSVKNISSNKKAASVKVLQGMPGRWVDNVTMRVYVAFPMDNPRKGDVAYGLFDGETVFWSVRLDGKRHNALMFIPPQLLDRYATILGAGRREMALAAGDFCAMVEFTDGEGKFLGREFLSNSQMKGTLRKAFFDAIKERPDAMYIRGAVLPKNRTPWAWHAPATFDYIKENASGKSEKQ